MTHYPIPDAALDDRLAIVGTAGAGKTYAAMTAVERLLDRGARVVVPDPLGVWFGLRLTADGAGQAYPVVVVGGPHADLPVNEHAGALIGETIARASQSFILDLSELGTKAAERRFMLAMLTALYRQASGEPVHIVFDEADMWAPQKLLDKDGDAAKLLGQMETIVRRGRVKGFIPWLITQRPAVLSKDVLSQVDGLIAMKLTSSQDRGALGAWIEGQADVAQGKAIDASLPTFQRGQGVVWMPARGILETVQFPAKKTFDSSRTPKRGEARRNVVLKPVDIEALRGRLATVESEIAANDPKRLKARIAELEREKAKSAPDDQTIGDAWAEGYARGADEGFKSGMDAGVTVERQRLGQKVLDFAATFALETAQPISHDVTPPKSTIIPKVHKPATPPPNVANSDMSPSSIKLVDAIVAAYPISISLETAAKRAGLSRRSSAFGRYLKEAAASPRITDRGDGRYVAVAPEEGIQAPAGLSDFKRSLPPSYAKMLEALEVAPADMSKEEIADAAGVSRTSSGLSAGLNELIALGLAEEDGRRYRLSRDFA